MKNKNTYMSALIIFLMIVMATLVMQYPHFKFQLENINDDHDYCYELTGENVEVSNYYATASSYYGGASVSLDSKEKTLSAAVTLESGEVLKHQLAMQDEGQYLMDVLKVEGEKVAPQKMVVTKKDGTVVTEGKLSKKLGELYQASNYDYSFLNIFINEAGVFMGRFEAYDAKQLKKDYSLVTIEFCHEDESKSSGYQLLARTQMDMETFLNEENLGYIPFLKTAQYDKEKSVEVIITFESAKRQSIVMSLEKGVN